MYSEKLKTKWLDIINQYDTCLYLDSNQDTQDRYARYECIASAGVQDKCEIFADWQPAFDFVEQNKGKWIFFAFSYEAYHAPLSLPYQPFTQPTAVLWTPEYWITLSKNLEIQSNDIPFFEQKIFVTEKPIPKVDLLPLWTKEDYFDRFNKVIEHIKEGDVYELNLCQLFKATVSDLNTKELFKRIRQQAKMPYSVYWKYAPHVVMSSSPERFLALQGNTLIAQPMKGTQRKTTHNDIEGRFLLQNSLKNRAENIMIVDLMRNDLAKSCVTGSIHTEHLFEVLDYGNLYQMISTVKGKPLPEYHFLRAFYNVFPAGSMTGAPKKRSVQIIHELENVPRGWFSGSIGYINPYQEADSNVLIRTLCYDTRTQELLLHTGGAVVYHSDAVQEYEETLLKGERIRNLLANSS
jgi:para-aminobenzoate synthetase component 1